MPFDPVDPRQSFPALEHGILKYWREEAMFHRSIAEREGGPVFSFYDGPPFATGLPHYGHLLAGTIKDVIPRYRTMRGDQVQRRFGWDCHGLPIENLIEKEHGIKNKQEIEEMGVAKFNALCRASVQRYTKEWRTVVERTGRWVDMDWDYRTMDPEYMESMWWAFSELHKKKLLYEGHKPMHICPRCVTPLSNFEVTQGYADRTDMSTIATFPLVDDPNTILLAWTTTTWSLPGDLWLGLGPEIEYVSVQQEGDDRTYIVAKKLAATVFKDRAHTVTGTIDAKKFVGKKYVPPFDYFIDTVMPSTVGTKKPKTFGDAAFTIIFHPEVSEDEGTGIVHFANTNSEDGFLIAKELGVDLLHYFGVDGRFYSEVHDFAGMQIKPEGDQMKTDKVIIEKLKEIGRHFKSYTINHSYPHCWRCDTPLLNYATSSWFIKVESLKAKMLKNAKTTEWVPSHLRDGRFGKWLEGARDWAISRNRYWGTPLPIWRNENGDMEVISGRDDLMAHAKMRFTKLTVLRHGESEGNLIPVYQGKLPGTDLSKQGKDQAKATAAALKDTDVAVIYASPLARCQQTAQCIAEKTGARIVTDERLREVGFGDYEGKTIDFSDLSLLVLKRNKKIEDSSPESIFHFPGMESWSQVQSRVADFLTEILPRHRSEHIVIVTHADPVINIRHFFTKEDPLKLSHQPFPGYAAPEAFFYDHATEAQMDLHKETVDTVIWQGSPSKNSVELTLARHGQTDHNRNKIVQGSEQNLPLNEDGRAQAAELAKKMKGKKFDVILSSHLTRAVETAEVVSKALGIPVAEKNPLFRERDLGSWSGRTQDDVRRENPPAYEGIHPNVDYRTPPGGESVMQCLKRAQDIIEHILQRYPGKKVLLVGHGGFMHWLHTAIENLSYFDATEAVKRGNCDTVTLRLHPPLRRIPEVVDCWFESGSMPYAAAHFPFKDIGQRTSDRGQMKLKNSTSEVRSPKSEVLPPGFPADFIAEGVDQTRTWFYTLMILSTALFDASPYKHVVVNGIVLAEDGKKMSKRLKNYPDPMEVVEKYGADALRFSLMSSPAVRAEDLRFSEKYVEEIVRSVVLPLWNSYSFFITYANAATFEPVTDRSHSPHPLDRMIRAEVQDLVNRMTKELDGYDLSATCSELHETVDLLTNWYIRLSRRRFAGKGNIDAAEAHIEDHEQDRIHALNTLYDVLITIAQLLAPFCPFVTEAMYLNLAARQHGSVHLTDWPQPRTLTKEEKMILERTRMLRAIVSLGMKVRSDTKVKVRQPLVSASVAVPDALLKTALSEEDRDLLRQELNVKEIIFVEDPGTLGHAIAQVDARKVGPRLGARVQDVIVAGKKGEFSVEENGEILILDERLGPDEVAIIYQGREGSGVAADRGIVVSLDTRLTPELTMEGEARDLIRAIQKLRKDEGYELGDRVTVGMDEKEIGSDLLKKFGPLIMQEAGVTFGPYEGQKHAVTIGDDRGVTLCMKSKKL
ncbi:class I tRNA ligase family protein [Candidatus Peregrinibacteria bacterium]|nr:class I tRNA ligase family protein [Candidatus Peregrinibacteria bacterium]